jgi:hypothetical protein
MKIVIIFKNGPEWDPEDGSVVMHHLANGASESFIMSTMSWIFKNPLADAKSFKPEDANTGINWTTELYLNDVPNVEEIAASIKEKYENEFIPELSKIGYSIEVSIEK